MQEEKLKPSLEAILFACGTPVETERIAQALEISTEQAAELCEALKEEYSQRNSGIRIVKLGGSYQMCSVEEYAPQIRIVMDLRRNTPLSQAAAEVLAVIAYNQPVTKAFVEQVRGVDCSGVMTTLIEKGLIEERGRLELPGRPLLYGTTKNFLRTFGISDLSELPKLPDEEHTVNDLGEQLAIQDPDQPGEEE